MIGVMWTDTHAHVTMPPLVGEVEAVLERAQLAGVGRLVNICTDEKSLARGRELAKKYPWFFNAAAATPHDIESVGESFFPLVEKCARSGELSAIGETGLDYYYAHTPKNLQQAHLLRYFELAKREGLPLVFHCREAFSDLFALADTHLGKWPCVLHCFTGTLKEAEGVLERGWYLSLSGIVTFKKAEALREVALMVPLDRLLLETDAPYLAPQNHRGKQNEPAYLVETGALIAALKNIPPSVLAEITTTNAQKLFVFQK